MSKTVIYIHGYTGEHGYNPNSTKIQTLKAHCKEHGLDFHNPRYPDHDPKASHQVLTDFIKKVKRKDPHPMLVGTSLGGFWAHRLSNEHSLPSVLVNPAIDPHNTLVRHVTAGRMSSSALKTYEQMQDHTQKAETVKEHRHVLLEAGDTVIDPHKTRSAYEGHAKVKFFEGGNHQFTRHDEIVNSIEELRNNISNHSNHA